MGFKPKDFGHIYHFNQHLRFIQTRSVRRRIVKSSTGVQASLQKRDLKFWTNETKKIQINESIVFIEELEELEFEGMLMRARAYLNRTHLLFLFEGTSFASVFTNWQLWLNLAVFWISRYLQATPLNLLPSLCSTALGICTTLAQWTLVFYINQCYARFNMQYNFCTSSSGAILDACKIARTCMSKAGQWRLFRLLNAAHLLTFIGIGDEYTEEGLFVPANERLLLLSPYEVKRIKKIGMKGPAASREVLVWAMQSIKQEYLDGNLSPREMKRLSLCVLSLRGSLARLFHFADFPIPFSYRHLIHLLVHFFLTLFAYSMAYSYNESQHSRTILNDSLIESAYVLFITATALSIVQLGTRIQDPFGHDSEDLPVVHFVTSLAHASFKVLCGPEIHKLSENLYSEMNLLQKRPMLGNQYLFHYGTVGVRRHPPEDLELEVFHLVCTKKVKLPNMHRIRVKKKKKRKSRNVKSNIYKIHPVQNTKI